MNRLLPAVLALVLLARGPARADDPFARGIDAVPIKLTPSMNSGLTLEGGELEDLQSYQLKAVLDLNVGILGVKLGDQRLGDLIPFRSDLHVMGAWQVLPRLELAADLPVTIFQASNFGLLSAQGFPQESPNVAGLGAPRLLGRYQLVRVRDVPLASVVAIAEVRLPIGDGFSFLSDRGFVFSPRVAAERHFGPVRVMANGGWRLRSAPGRYLNLYVGHEFMLGAGAQVELPEFWKFKQLRALGELNLATPAEAPFTFRDAEALKTALELTVGATAHLFGNWGVMAGVSKGLGLPGYGREAFRVFGGVTWEHQEVPDADGDGIPDSVDRCPNEAEVKGAHFNGDGCPDVEQLVDTDHDGVPDLIDACVDQAGPVELDGCPDRDGDQIADGSDQCPDQPGPPDLKGCPPPEEEAPVVLESERIRINNQVLFTLGKAVIDPKSYKLLNEVAKVLKEHPDVGPVLIEGHTDNSGPRAYNVTLSKQRAKAVEDYLVEKGIERTRLRSDGFGFDKPIAPNDTPINRAKNRRTEFKLVEKN